MKRTSKKIAAVFAAAAMVCTSGISSFAEKVVFEDSFERGSWIDNNFLVAPPEVKVYSENLMDDGDFENGKDIGRYSGHQTAWSINSIGSGNTYLKKSQDQKHGGNWSLCINPSLDTGSTSGKWTENNYPMLTVREGEKNGGRYDFTEGIYEITAWLYTDAPDYVVRSDTHNSSKVYLSQSGNACGQVVLESGKWQKIRQTISIPKSDTQVPEIYFTFKVVNSWQTNGDGAYYPLYIDDVTVRRVENAAVTDNTQYDNGTIVPSNQNGIARYTTEGIISTEDKIKTVEVTMTVNNENGEDDYHTALISALYDSEGRFLSVPGYAEEIISAGTEDYDIVSTFTIPAQAASGVKLINYLWENVDAVRPHVQKYVYPYNTTKLIMNDDGTLNYVPDKNIPDTQWKSAPYYTGYASHSYTATMFDQLSVGNGRTGMNSLFIPIPKTYAADGGVYNRGWVYRDMELEEGHTYKVTFYAMCDQDFLAFNVFPVGGLQASSINFAGLSLDTGMTSGVNFAGTRIYSNLFNWTPVTFTFTAAKTGTHSLAFTQGNNGYWNPGRAWNKGLGAFIDDVKITDITPAAAE